MWERLHSVHVMNSSSPEPVCYNAARPCQRGRDEALAASAELRLLNCESHRRVAIIVTRIELLRDPLLCACDVLRFNVKRNQNKM